jgi:hypothetical protein
MTLDLFIRMLTLPLRQPNAQVELRADQINASAASFPRSFVGFNVRYTAGRDTYCSMSSSASHSGDRAEITRTTQLRDTTLD